MWLMILEIEGLGDKGLVVLRASREQCIHERLKEESEIKVFTVLGIFYGSLRIWVATRIDRRPGISRRRTSPPTYNVELRISLPSAYEMEACQKVIKWSIAMNSDDLCLSWYMQTLYEFCIDSLERFTA